MIILLARLRREVVLKKLLVLLVLVLLLLVLLAGLLPFVLGFLVAPFLANSLGVFGFNKVKQKDKREKD